MTTIMKTYISPSVEFIATRPTDIICGSGEETNSLGVGDSNNKPTGDSQNIIWGD